MPSAPLRILHVAPFSPEAWGYGGVPRVVGALSAALARRGHEVTVVATDARDRRRRLPLAGDRGDRSDTFLAAPGEVDLRLFRNRSNRLAGAQLFLPAEMKAYLRENVGRFDVVHLHAFRNLPVAWAASAAVAAGVPFVFTPNGTAPRIESKRAAKAVWDLLFGRTPLERAARVLAVTEAERRELAELGVPAGRIEIVPNPVELEEFEAPRDPAAFRRRFGLEGTRIVLYLGRNSPRKRLDLLGGAFLGLPGSDLRLVIAGAEGPTEIELALAVLGENRGLGVGLLRGRDRLEALAAADVVAYAGEQEIFGLVPLEAILCGTPVVVADDSGAGEIVREIGGGTVVAAGNAVALRAGLESILSEPERWRREAAAAALRVRARFGAGVVAERLESMYRSVIAER